MALALDMVEDVPMNRCIMCLKCIYRVKEAFVIIVSTIVGLVNLSLSIPCLLFLFPCNMINTVRGFDLDLLMNLVLVLN